MPVQAAAHDSSSVRPTVAVLFSEPLTAILRVRYGKQSVDDPASFREHMRQLLRGSIEEARSRGYSSQHTQMAVLSAVGFLDESVLNLRNAAAEAWARRPLQEELFGGHTAGETFFQNLSLLLREETSPEVADILELHCQCLLLGYKGRYAFGNAGELASLLRAAQEKIVRTRGGTGMLLQPPAYAAPPTTVRRDAWGRGLLIAMIVLAGSVLLCFAAFTFSLHSGANAIADDSAMHSVTTAATGNTLHADLAGRGWA